MTSDQVLLDDAAAEASTATKPKTVRRRTTKKTEDAAAPESAAPLAEQPTLPDMIDGDAATSEPTKPKRTRTVKAKDEVPAPKTPKTKTTRKTKGAEETATPEATSEAAPLEAARETETQNGHFTNSSAIVLPHTEHTDISRTSETTAPVDQTQPEFSGRTETPAASDTTPSDTATSAEPEAPAPTRPSVPARFPSRFKRLTQAAPEPETAPAPVQEAPVATTTAAPAEAAPVLEAAVETREEATTQEPESEAPATSQFQDQGEAPTASETAMGEVGSQSDGVDGAPNTQQDGEYNPQNGEMPEGGFGRMRYRERREFRRQQRMQQRQERFGVNGEGQQPQGSNPNIQNGPGGQNGFNGRPGMGPMGYQPQPRRREYDFFTLQSLSEEELATAAQEYGVEMEVERDRQELVMTVMEAQARAQNSVLKTGILDAHDHNKAFLRCEGYTPSENDVYVSQTQIKRFNLKTGDLVFGTARAPKENERFFGLLRVESINGLSPDELRSRKDFEKMTPIFPDSRYHLETEQGNITARIIDLVSPLGKGQRGLVVAPPKAGKTTLLKSIANSITKNNPEAELFVLLIDERPEEVTDISRSVRGEVVASTFDEMPENHMRVADIVLERAKRLVEMKRDVVILLDSITRLSRASNLVVTPSGRTLSGGLDPAAMYRPKRMFGAARNIEEGGSLTILATALVDTGSRMDEMIFEEFKGTGNMDLVLDRDLFNQRIFPAIDINKSGTRRDDLLMSKDELAATFHLRQTLARLDNDQAVKLMIDRLKNTKSNSDFMAVVAKSARQAELKAAQ